jgi:hypothetical protein
MKFRKKPVVVEATQWFEHGDHPAVIREGTIEDYRGTTPDAPILQTLEGWVHIEPGDWIITGTAGELYPCKPHIFSEIYELVEEEVDWIVKDGVLCDRNEEWFAETNSWRAMYDWVED